MNFKPIKKLNVTRTLSTGVQVLMGTLAQNHNGVFFQYDAHYLTQFGNSSPFNLKNNTDLQIAPKNLMVTCMGFSLIVYLMDGVDYYKIEFFANTVYNHMKLQQWTD